MALCAAKRLNKLATKLRTIDNVLPNNNLSQSLNSRQKRFIEFLFVLEITYSTRRFRNASLYGDLFDKDCNLKNKTAPHPYYFEPAKSAIRLDLIHYMIRQDYQKQEIARCNFLMTCYLNKFKKTQLKQQTHPPPTTTNGINNNRLPRLHRFSHFH